MLPCLYTTENEKIYKLIIHEVLQNCCTHLFGFETTHQQNTYALALWQQTLHRRLSVVNCEIPRTFIAHQDMVKD